MDKNSRSYDSSRRKLMAQENRKRVITVSRKLFERQGFKGTSVEQIAVDSGLAKPTIYAMFKSKEGILLAIVDGSFAKESFEELVNQASKGKTAKERFEITAKLCRKLYEAESSNLASFRDFVGISPELKELEKKLEHRRYMRQERSVKQMKLKDFIKGNISEKKARDIIWALTGRDFYRMLVAERGWSPEQYEDWVASTLQLTLSCE